MVKELKAIFIFSFPGVFLFSLFDLIGVDPSQLWGIGYVAVMLLAVILLLWAFRTYYNLHQKEGRFNMKATEKKYANLMKGIHQALFACILGMVLIKAITSCLGRRNNLGCFFYYGRARIISQKAHRSL